MNLPVKRLGSTLTLVLATAGLGLASQAQNPENRPRVDATLSAQRGAIAESILAVKEEALGRSFDARIRASLKSRMESLSVEQLSALAQQGESADIPLALGSVTSDLVYTPVTPCRVFDSRVSQGGPGPIAANTQRNVFVAGSVANFAAQGGTAGGCGVPVGATSAIVNFVTVLPAGPGNIRAWAVADPQPAAPLAAVMNYGTVAGLPALANGVAVPLCDPAATSCALGDLRLQADTSATDILGDVVGYFAAVTPQAASVAAFGVGPITHYTGAGWVLETLAAATLQLRATSASFRDFGFVSPSSCTGNGTGGNATMTNPHRYSFNAGDTLSASFCAEGSTILATVFEDTTKLMTQFRCIRYAGNANVCARVY